MNSPLRCIGPRPYKRAEAQWFAGRDQEVTELLSLLRVHKVVLLEGESGVGKTSLVNAGLTPLLEREGADVLPYARFCPRMASFHGATGNPLVWSVLFAWHGDPQEATRSLTSGLVRWLAARPRPTGFGVLPALRIIVLDEGAALSGGVQPSDLADLAEQLHSALHEDPLLRILRIADRIHGDRAADGQASYLPAEASFTLAPLSRAEALASVHQLAAGVGLEITGEAAAKLVGDLVTTKLRTVGGRVERVGEQVDPMHLQLAWRAAVRALAATDTLVRLDHVAHVTEEQIHLEAFYTDVVQQAADEAGLSSQDLMRWIAHEFLDDQGSRVSVPREGDVLRGLPYAAAEALTAQGLLMKDVMAGVDWFELGHDRLVPIVLAHAQEQIPHRAAPDETLEPEQPEAAPTEPSPTEPVAEQGAAETILTTQPEPEAPQSTAAAISEHKEATASEGAAAPEARAAEPVAEQGAEETTPTTQPAPRAQAQPRVSRALRWIVVALIVVLAAIASVVSVKRHALHRTPAGIREVQKQFPAQQATGGPIERTEAAKLADALLAQALASARTGFVTEGLQHAKQALGIYEHARDVSGRADALTVVGLLYGACGKLSDAAYCYGEAARLREMLKDAPGAATLLALQGDVELASGDASSAASSYRKALEIRRSLGQLGEQFSLLLGLGRAYAAHRWWEGALNTLRSARDLARQMHDTALEAQALEALASVYDASGAPVTARGLRAGAASLRKSAGQNASIPMGAGASLPRR